MDEAPRQAVTAQLDIPEGDLLVAVLSVRLQPDQVFSMQLHPAQGIEQLNPHALAELLRWMADRLDIEGL